MKRNLFKRLGIIVIAILVVIFVLLLPRTPSLASAKKEVENFENFILNKNFVTAINLMTNPGNGDEQQWQDHLLGNDLRIINNGKSSPRFTNSTYYYVLDNYMISQIEQKDKKIFISVKETRTLPTEDGEGQQSERRKSEDLVFELEKYEGKYKISRYYHLDYSGNINLKYQGFVSD